MQQQIKLDQLSYRESYNSMLRDGVFHVQLKFICRLKPFSRSFASCKAVFVLMYW